MWKKRLLVSVAGILFITALSSYAFNFPLRFRRVPRFAPQSQAPARPSTTAPDNIVLTPAGDMSREIRVTWRASASVPDGAVRFDDTEVWATARAFPSPELTSDGTVHCFTATLRGLRPGTTYAYRVGSPSLGIWSAQAEFTTAPEEEEEFSFVYFGDVQNDSEAFGGMLRTVAERHPETALYLMGGDLVDAGESRNLWDAFFAEAAPLYSRVPVAPALGNHEYAPGGVGVAAFALQFGLPVPPHPDDIRGYSFRRGNAFFAVINTPESADHADWLEAELKKAREDGCAFSIVMFHEPVHHPRRGRSNRGAEKYLLPIFETYGVDLVLTCHDHSYLRSKPLRADGVAPPGGAGTVCVVATSCDRFYPFLPLDIAEVQLTDVKTYQVITLGKDADGRPLLRYAAHRVDGTVVDAFETRK